MRRLLASSEAAAAGGGAAAGARHGRLLDFHDWMRRMKAPAPLAAVHLTCGIRGIVYAHPGGKPGTHLTNAVPRMLAFLGCCDMPPHNNPAELAERDNGDVAQHRPPDHHAEVRHALQTLALAVTSSKNGMLVCMVVVGMFCGPGWNVYSPRPCAGLDRCALKAPASRLVRPPDRQRRPPDRQRRPPDRQRRPPDGSGSLLDAFWQRRHVSGAGTAGCGGASARQKILDPTTIVHRSRRLWLSGDVAGGWRCEVGVCHGCAQGHVPMLPRVAQALRPEGVCHGCAQGHVPVSHRRENAFADPDSCLGSRSC